MSDSLQQEAIKVLSGLATMRRQQAALARQQQMDAYRAQKDADAATRQAASAQRAEENAARSERNSEESRNWQIFQAYQAQRKEAFDFLMNVSKTQAKSEIEALKLQKELVGLGMPLQEKRRHNATVADLTSALARPFIAAWNKNPQSTVADILGKNPDLKHTMAQARHYFVPDEFLAQLQTAADKGKWVTDFTTKYIIDERPILRRGSAIEQMQDGLAKRDPVTAARVKEAAEFITTMTPEKWIAQQRQIIGGGGGGGLAPREGQQAPAQAPPTIPLGEAGGKSYEIQDPRSFAGTFESEKQGKKAVPTYNANPLDRAAIERMNEQPTRTVALESQQDAIQKLFEKVRQQNPQVFAGNPTGSGAPPVNPPAVNKPVKNVQSGTKQGPPAPQSPPAGDDFEITSVPQFRQYLQSRPKAFVQGNRAKFESAIPTMFADPATQELARSVLEAHAR